MSEFAHPTGRSFAVVYVTYQVVQTGLWYSVWRQDRRDHLEFRTETGAYVVGTGVSVAAILASTLLPAGPRVIVWAGLAFAWIVGIMLAALRCEVGRVPGVTPGGAGNDESAADGGSATL